MKTPPLTLNEVYLQTLSEVYAAEKKYMKCFQQMAEAAFTDELRSAINPEGTDLENHLSRLTQIMETANLKTSRITSALDDELLVMGKEICGFQKQQSVLKDIQILQVATQLVQIRIAAYEALYQMATALKIEKAAVLLEQCFKDYKNTVAYLSQIAQNIIYPAAERA
ncbi:DUF892 family protein [Pedobacter duraquae]|uniref:Ferritin-like metal-binding protein YciE n=1 Tax=Pedobacter duraquae TaxID=425511 RepID=A0A4V6PSF8_9SPHI|nr:DUF892 family protein [Pedobacter duraquae]TDO23928.1 ferritin-like metal-binding protein YciE [Pedobacter duraquae]